MHKWTWIPATSAAWIKETRSASFTCYNLFLILPTSLPISFALSRFGVGIRLCLGLRLWRGCHSNINFVSLIFGGFCFLFLLVCLFVFLFHRCGCGINLWAKSIQDRCGVVVMLRFVNAIDHGLPQPLERPNAVSNRCWFEFVHFQCKLWDVFETLIQPRSKDCFVRILWSPKARKHELHPIPKHFQILALNTLRLQGQACWLAEAHSALFVKTKLFTGSSRQNMLLHLHTLTNTAFLQCLGIGSKSTSLYGFKQLGTEDSVEHWKFIRWKLYTPQRTIQPAQQFLFATLTTCYDLYQRILRSPHLCSTFQELGYFDFIITLQPH